MDLINSLRLRMKRLAAGLTAVLLTALASAAGANTLTDISFTSLPGDRVQVRLKLDEPMASDPLSFTIDNPARVALDFPGTKLNLDERTKAIGIGNAESISAVEAGGRTRVVLNLAQLIPYEVTTSGSTVIVTLAGTPADIVAERVGAATALSDAPASIHDIDFRRGPVGEARVVVT
ncbi:MAG: AMIN domain-containing protein, partial [Gammaproteobacteria bacterium]|nr:AMIN domain-containing protein [Gammaproteobacteria bacterium]